MISDLGGSPLFWEQMFQFVIPVCQRCQVHLVIVLLLRQPLIHFLSLCLCILQGMYLDAVHGGMTFSNINYGQFPISYSLTMLFVDFVLYGLLAVYLDNVVPGEYRYHNSYHTSALRSTCTCTWMTSVATANTSIAICVMMGSYISCIPAPGGPCGNLVLLTPTIHTAGTWYIH